MGVRNDGRGWRAGDYIRKRGRTLSPKDLEGILKSRTDLSLRMARIAVPPEHRRVAELARPLIRLAHAAYVRGVTKGNWASSHETAPMPGWAL